MRCLRSTRARAARLPQHRARRGVTLFAVVALALVVLIVVMVSLPRLREFGLRENANDAERAVRRAALLLGAPANEARSLREIVAADAILRRGVVDGEWSADGRLRCHGYLYELRTDAGRAELYAWPWAHGRTGLECYAASGGAAKIWRHANAQGSASGPEHPPARLGDAGWDALP